VKKEIEAGKKSGEVMDAYGDWEITKWAQTQASMAVIEQPKRRNGERAVFKLFAATRANRFCINSRGVADPIRKSVLIASEEFFEAGKKSHLPRINRKGGSFALGKGYGTK